MTLISRDKIAFKYLMSLAIVFLVGGTTTNTSCLAQEQTPRSTDTHAIDEFPIFDRSENEEPTRTVERAAEKQINDSIKKDQLELVEPAGSGRVLTTSKQKNDVSNESTKIGKDIQSEP